MNDLQNETVRATAVVGRADEPSGSLTDGMWAEIDAMITHRILTFHDALVRRGQISPIAENEGGCPVTLQSSHCTPLADKPLDWTQGDPAALQGEPA